jgi:hypothetical protein
MANHLSRTRPFSSLLRMMGFLGSLRFDIDGVAINGTGARAVVLSFEVSGAPRKAQWLLVFE